jgi:phage host-nuclease inhibitor protein Gam
VSIDEAPQWIDDIDPPFESDDSTVPEDDDAEARAWVDMKLRRISYWQREKRLQEGLIANEEARIAKYRKDTLAQIERAIAFHETPVLAWAAHMNERDPQTRSRTFPHGTVRARALPDAIEVDDDVTLPWLMEFRPDLVRTKPSVDKQALRDEIKNGWEADIPGVAVTTARVKYTVETDGIEA